MELHNVSIVIYEHGAIKIIAKYIQLKKKTYYYRRRLPDDIARHYPKVKGFLFFSLKTKDAKEAARLANAHARSQDALWKAYRSGATITGPEEREAAMAFLASYDLKPGQSKEYERNGIEPDDFLNELVHLSQDRNDPPTIIKDSLPAHVALAADFFYGAKSIPTLSETLKLHRELSGIRPSDKSEQARENAIGRLLDLSGDLPIDQYKREDANELVRTLMSSGVATTTVKRYLNYISPVFATGINEYELNKQNIFHALKIPGYGSDVKTRAAFTTEELVLLQSLCRNIDDRLRWAIAVLTDTGMRLAEVIGLQRDDFNFDGPIPFVQVRPNAGRQLKNTTSKRAVPLVGISLWGAQRLSEMSGDGYFFPNYISDGMNKATHASNAMNKWVREQGINKTMHSLRHSMRDRLRNVNAPTEVADRIGGWATKSVGEGYGEGHELEVLHDWLHKIVLD